MIAIGKIKKTIIDCVYCLGYTKIPLQNVMKVSVDFPEMFAFSTHRQEVFCVNVENVSGKLKHFMIIFKQSAPIDFRNLTGKQSRIRATFSLFRAFSAYRWGGGVGDDIWQFDWKSK